MGDATRRAMAEPRPRPCRCLHVRPRAEMSAQLERRFAHAFAAASSDAWLKQFGWKVDRG